MTVADLIQLLEDCDPDSEVVIAQQERYPLLGKCYGVTTQTALAEYAAEAEGEDAEEFDEDEALPVVYIASGTASEYAPAHIWNAINEGRI